MKIRPKVTVLIAALFVVLGVAEILVEKSVFMPRFAELERAGARTSMRRINYALDLELERLTLSATDWGDWTDTYRFAQDRDHRYIAENTTSVTLRQINVNAMLVIAPDGDVILSSDLSLASDQPLRLNLVARSQLAGDFPWRENLRSGRPAQGFLQTNRGILMLAAAPILDGHGRGPARGMVMMGRLLSADEIARVGAQAQVKMSMLAPRNIDGPDQLVETATVTHVYQSFNDLYGRPIMTLRVDVPREITMRGQSAVTYASVYLMVAAVIILILLVIILSRVVLTPLARMTRHAVAIGNGKDLTKRLDFESNDEIGVLAREFDRMVARVAESRRQLVDQSFQAGFAELAKGVLHNLGNAMTPIGVRLSGLSDRLRAAPTEEVDQAVGELEGNTVDSQRRVDLERFLRLASQELARVVNVAESDVTVMSRQVAVVQTALSEQMRATRNEHVIESVRLPELVAQSLEIVPDSCRQRLTVDSDESLMRVGVVQVARTVLRLVLQNLIINAADAVREAGKDKGVLRVAADIVREGDREQLHLHCHDNGIGIVAENLQRVFEKGFSTKSKETNYGIGLHWCANAVGALGGRIWATSAGVGCGASMHLLVPLAPPVVVPLVVHETAPLAEIS